MKPVNLLPQNERAIKPAEGLGGSSFVVLGVLGALLVAAVAFVFFSNQVNDRSAKIAAAEAQAGQAEQRAATLGAFGDFASVKAQREQSVRNLAKSRFDWERFMRELALVLPKGTSLLNVGTSTSATDASGATTSSSSSTPPATGTGTPAAGPQAQLQGCAKSQKRVAVLLVRLRSLHRASEVTLKQSSMNDQASGDSASQDSAAVGGGSASCAQGRYAFDVTVDFAPADGSSGKSEPKTPARLGGGA